MIFEAGSFHIISSAFFQSPEQFFGKILQAPLTLGVTGAPGNLVLGHRVWVGHSKLPGGRFFSAQATRTGAFVTSAG